VRLDLADDALDALHHLGEIELDRSRTDAELLRALTCDRSLAERISALDGTQPVLSNRRPCGVSRSA